MKLLIRLAFVGLALVVIAAVVGLGSIGKIVVVAVEKGGSHALGVPTSLGDADIGLFSGQLGLNGLEVANPAGFEREHFLRMDDARLEVSLGSLRSDLVEAPLLLFEGVEVSLERRDGKTNYGAILENLERLKGEEQERKEGGEPKEEEGEQKPKEDEPEQLFVIRRVVLRDIVAHVDLLPAGGEWTKIPIRIPELTLENVGNEAGSVADVVGQVVTALVGAVVRAGGDAIPAEMLNDLKADLAALADSAWKLDDETLAELNVLADELSESFGGQAGELLDEAGKKLGKGLEGLLKRD